MVKSFLKFLGVQQQGATEEGVRHSPSVAEETESIRHIVRSLEALPISQARYLALFASILARVAHADLHISEEEKTQIEKILMEIDHLEESQAVLVAEIAKSQNQLLGGVDNYLITREFKKIATDDQRWDLLESLFIVAAIEAGISAEENSEIQKIAEELGFSRKELLGVRARFKKDLNIFQGMPQA